MTRWQCPQCNTSIFLVLPPYWLLYGPWLIASRLFKRWNRDDSAELEGCLTSHWASEIYIAASSYHNSRLQAPLAAKFVQTEQWIDMSAALFAHCWIQQGPQVRLGEFTKALTQLGHVTRVTHFETWTRLKRFPTLGELQPEATRCWFQVDLPHSSCGVTSSVSNTGTHCHQSMFPALWIAAEVYVNQSPRSSSFLVPWFQGWKIISCQGRKNSFSRMYLQ